MLSEVHQAGEDMGLHLLGFPSGIETQYSSPSTLAG